MSMAGYGLQAAPATNAESGSDGACGRLLWRSCSRGSCVHATRRGGTWQLLRASPARILFRIRVPSGVWDLVVGSSQGTSLVPALAVRAATDRRDIIIRGETTRPSA